MQKLEFKPPHVSTCMTITLRIYARPQFESWMQRSYIQLYTFLDRNTYTYIYIHTDYVKPVRLHIANKFFCVLLTARPTLHGSTICVRFLQMCTLLHVLRTIYLPIHQQWFEQRPRPSPFYCRIAVLSWTAAGALQSFRKSGPLV